MDQADTEYRAATFQRSIAVRSPVVDVHLFRANRGPGNVVVHIPLGIAAKVRARSGVGKVVVDWRFQNMDSSTFQSADYDQAANKVEVIAASGAANVTVITP